MDECESFTILAAFYGYSPVRNRHIKCLVAYNEKNSLVKHTINIAFVAFLFSISICNCTNSKSIRLEHDAGLAKIILDSSMNVYGSKTQMPKIAKRIFEKIYSYDKNLADTGQVFIETDFHAVYIPNRRFIIGANDVSKSNGFFLYETGGSIGDATCIIYSYQTRRDPIKVQFISLIKRKEIDALRKAVRNKEYTVLKGVGQ